MTEPGLAREVRRLAWPAIAHSFLHTLVFVVDRVMLGRLGETPLAAMQIAGPLEWSVFSVLLAFEVGVIARVGFHVGAGRGREARAAATAGLGLALAFGSVVLALTPLLLANLALIAPSASPDALAQARDYLAVTLYASPIVFVGAAGVAVLQASGDTKTPLFVAALCNLVHVPLNRVLILGAFGVPAMGTLGCGISTAITFTLQAALILAVLARAPRSSSSPGRFSLRAPPEERIGALAMRAELADKGREIVRVAWPSVLERALYHAGFMGFVMMVGRLGDRVMAGNQVLISVEAVCFLSADGFGIAAAALVAQKLGAGKPRLATQAAWIATRDAAILLSTLGIVVFVFRRFVIAAFVPEGEVADVADSAVFVLMVAQPFMAMAIVLAQALRGAGRTKEVLLATSFSAVAVRLGATYLFAFAWGGGLRGVWWGSTTDWVVRAAILVVIVRAVFAARAERAPS